ncbi:IucA/IucC family siderophore biosynthesis protein [Streptomyces sp. NPDC006649]|uniref:IucA/IucC family siderophore biosynthesis protein n=1 Tax=unclassified Streptomyces TaxID=2593676 RepID=UPI002F91A32C
MVYRAELAAARPDMLSPYDAAYPLASAAVLGRLWGALAREPLPGLANRRSDGSSLTVTFDNGRRVTGPSAAAGLVARDLTALMVDGRAVNDPRAVVLALWPGAAGARFAGEVTGSVAGLALARAHRPHADAETGERDSTWYEQSVVDGHPLHPCCRNRPGMSLAETLAYAPEFRPVLDLPLVAVPRARLHTHAPNWPLTEGEHVLLPVHPWQRDHVLPRYGLAPATSMRARPLMSLRTLATDRWQIKTSIDVQLTSAVRGLSARSLHNGPALSRVLPDVPGLALLRDVHAAGIDAHLAAVLRQPPEHHLAPGHVAVPLSALPGAGVDVAAAVAAIVPALLRMLDRGVALEAHGQNTLLTLDADGSPKGLLYRDLSSIRASPHRLGGLPPLHGSVACDDPDVLHAKLAAAMVATLAELVHSAGDPGLWGHVAHHIDSTYAELPADDWNRRHHALFFAPRLPVKAYTAKRLAGDAHTDTWAWIANPYAALR